VVLASAAPTLADLLARTLPRDPQVRVAQAMLQATEDRRLQLRSRFAPLLGLTATYGEGTDVEFFRPVDRTSQKTDATLRWNLYNGGADSVEWDAAQREVAAAEQDLRRARQEVAERVTEAALELGRIDLQLALAGERMAVVRRLAQQVATQAELGRLSDADLQEATASLVNAEIELDQFQSDRVGALERLSTLLGETVVDLLPPTLPPAVAGDAPAALHAARLRSEAARLRVRSLESVLAPRLDLDMQKRLTDKTTPPMSTETRNAWTVAVRWEFPLGGEPVHRRNEVERRAEAAEAEIERLEQGLRGELAALAPRIASAERAIALLDRQIAQLAAIARAGELQFEAGRRTLQQLIQAHEAHHASMQRRADQQWRLQVARLRNLSLVGELLPSLGLDGGAVR
jgi:outer membrane protein TolC